MLGAGQVARLLSTSEVTGNRWHALWVLLVTTGICPERGTDSAVERCGRGPDAGSWTLVREYGGSLFAVLSPALLCRPIPPQYHRRQRKRQAYRVYSALRSPRAMKRWRRPSSVTGVIDPKKSGRPWPSIGWYPG